LRHSLAAHFVRTTAQEGWDKLQNGALLAAAVEAGFDVFVTCDQNIAYQQNISRRRVAIVAINTNSWPVIGADMTKVVQAVDVATIGSFVTVIYQKPDLRRRPYTPPRAPGEFEN
jgi:hypothetical protein